MCHLTVWTPLDPRAPFIRPQDGDSSSVHTEGCCLGTHHRRGLSWMELWSAFTSKSLRHMLSALIPWGC